MKFDGETYYLKDVFTFRRDASSEAKELRERGYEARVKNIREGWAVYYR